MTAYDKENLIKEIDVEIAYQKSIISNNNERISYYMNNTPEFWQEEVQKSNVSIYGARCVVSGLEIAKAVILNYTE